MLQKTLERSGSKIWITILLTMLIVKIPIWTGMLHLGEPWNDIAAECSAFVVGLLKMWRIQRTTPTVDATTLPPDVIMDMGSKDKYKVLDAIDRQMDKQT